MGTKADKFVGLVKQGLREENYSKEDLGKLFLVIQKTVTHLIERNDVTDKNVFHILEDLKHVPATVKDMDPFFKKAYGELAVFLTKSAIQLMNSSKKKEFANVLFQKIGAVARHVDVEEWRNLQKSTSLFVKYADANVLASCYLELAKSKTQEVVEYAVSSLSLSAHHDPKRRGKTLEVYKAVAAVNTNKEFLSSLVSGQKTSHLKLTDQEKCVVLGAQLKNPEPELSGAAFKQIFEMREVNPSLTVIAFNAYEFAIPSSKEINLKIIQHLDVMKALTKTTDEKEKNKIIKSAFNVAVKALHYNVESEPSTGKGADWRALELVKGLAEIPVAGYLEVKRDVIDLLIEVSKGIARNSSRNYSFNLRKEAVKTLGQIAIRSPLFHAKILKALDPNNYKSNADFRQLVMRARNAIPKDQPMAEMAEFLYNDLDCPQAVDVLMGMKVRRDTRSGVR